LPFWSNIISLIQNKKGLKRIVTRRFFAYFSTFINIFNEIEYNNKNKKMFVYIDKNVYIMYNLNITLLQLCYIQITILLNLLTVLFFYNMYIKDGGIFMMEIKDFDQKTSEAIKLASYIKRKYLEYDKNINKREISPIKLQKSLYFLFAYWGQYIKKNKENKDSVEVDYSNYSELLFNDRIEAWTYGPVLPNVFMAEKLNTLETEKDDNYLENDLIKKEFVDNLLYQLFEIDDFSLVRLSHEDECWRRNYIDTDEKHNREIPKEEIINEYFAK